MSPETFKLIVLFSIGGISTLAWIFIVAIGINLVGQRRHRGRWNYIELGGLLAAALAAGLFTVVFVLIYHAYMNPPLLH